MGHENWTPPGRSVGETGATSPANQDPDQWFESADETATVRFHKRVLAYQEETRRRRFAGENPVLRPRTRKLYEAAAATVAAERIHGVVQLGEERLNPSEDRAATELHAALRALTIWDFRTVGRCLEATEELAQLPVLQQQVSLVQHLADLVRQVFYSEPGTPWSNADRALLTLIPALDRLSPEEGDFYAAEAVRLRQAWDEAGQEDLMWTGWALARARGSAQEGHETQLAWLLRIWHRNVDRLPPNDSLQTLIERAKAVFQLLLPTGSESDREVLERQASDASPRDLLTGLGVALSTAYGTDVLHVSNRFAPMVYRAPSLADGRDS